VFLFCNFAVGLAVTGITFNVRCMIIGLGWANCTQCYWGRTAAWWSWWWFCKYTEHNNYVTRLWCSV